MTNPYFFINGESYLKQHNSYANVFRYLCKTNKRQKPIVLCIFGPSGMGKSSFALELGHKLGIRTIIGTDSIKLALSVNSTNNFLKLFSHECWKEISVSSTKKSVIEGFLQQSNLLEPAIETLLNHSKQHVQNTIIEGIHLTPNFVERLKSDDLALIPIYICSSFETFLNYRIRQRFYSTYMHRSPERYSQDRKNIYKIFYDWWNKEIQGYNFIKLTNEEEPKKSLKRCMDEIEIYIAKLNF